MIDSGTKGRDIALKEAYQNQKLKLSVRKVISQMGAQSNDFTDIFQDAIIIFDRNVRRGKFKGDSAIITYITGIARWHWLGQQRKNRKTQSTDQIEKYDKAEIDKTEEMIIAQERKEQLRQVMKKLDEKCRDLLKMSMLGLTMKEMAAKKEIAEQSAKNAVHRCRQKLRNIINDSGFEF